VQSFAVALGVYADTASLGFDSTAQGFGFISVPGGGGSATFKVGNNGAAFGVANGSTITVTQALQAANANFTPATGLFYFGSQTQTSALNNVVDGINSVGDIPGSSSSVGGGGSTVTTLTDSATVSGGVNPTGTMVFYLMAPGATASTPLTSAVYTDTVSVTGDGTYTTSQGTSTGSAVPTQTGTYQWVVVFTSANSTNTNATSPFGSEPWTVGSASPTINTIDGGSVVLGTGAKLTDTAQLADGASPTGTITFYLFAPGVTPNATDSNNVYSDVVAVNGNANYSTATGTTPGGYLPTVTGTFQWVAVYSGDHNNAMVSSAFGDEPETVSTSTPVGAGGFATIGFWHNQNGQAVINSFNGGSTQTLLGNWLATNFPHLFGATNPYISATLASLPGHPTTLAGLTNAQIATVYENLWTPSGVTKNTYVQAFAVALGMYADTGTLGYNTTAAKYGFKQISGGGGSLTYNVGSNGAAFGVANNSTLTVSQLLQIVDGNFNPSTGNFYGGDQTKTSDANNVLNGINTTGDITNATGAPANPAAPGQTVYNPSQVLGAYGTGGLGLDGTGQTIAIVEAYDTPTIFQTVDTFDNYFGLTAGGPTLY